MASNPARARKRQILTEIAKLDFCPPGSLVERTTRCSTPTCRCHTDPERRHGPYPTWIRKEGPRTITHTLSPAQAERFRPWFDNTLRLRDLVAQLEALSVHAINETEGWTDTARPPRRSLPARPALQQEPATPGRRATRDKSDANRAEQAQ